MRPSPRHETEPDPLNPWDAVNACKLEIAALVAGAAPEVQIAEVRARLDALESEMKTS